MRSPRFDFCRAHQSGLSPHDTVEVQFDFPIHHTADAFDKTRRFVVSFALPFDGCQRSSRRDGERALMNDLIPGVELWDDEVDRRSKRQHVAGVGVLIRMETGKRW